MPALTPLGYALFKKRLARAASDSYIIRDVPCVDSAFKGPDMRRVLHCVLFCVVILSSGIASRAATVQLPTITIPSIPQHTYSTDGFGDTHIFDRFHVTTGASTYTTGTFTGTWAQGDTLVQKIAAPAGKRFAVTFSPSAFQPNFLSFETKWKVIGTTPSFNPSTFTLAGFDNLTGPAPSASVPNSFVEDDYLDMNWAGSTNASSTFTAINLTLQVPAGGGKPTAAPMTLDSFFINSDAFFLGTPADATFLRIESIPEPTGLMAIAALIPTLARRR
jgi:hypothetical protein